MKKQSMKLGDQRNVEKYLHRWGGRVDMIWLTKCNEYYQVMGLIKNENNGKNLGWGPIFESKNLKECKAYAKALY